MAVSFKLNANFVLTLFLVLKNVNFNYKAPFLYAFIRPRDTFEGTLGPSPASPGNTGMGGTDGALPGLARSTFSMKGGRGGPKPQLGSDPVLRDPLLVLVNYSSALSPSVTFCVCEALFKLYFP